MEITTNILYILRNGIFLYFGKGIFKTRGIFRTRSIFKSLKYLEPWHIQNHSILRTWGIFRTLPNIYDGTFCKNSYLEHFLIFRKMKLSSFSELEKWKEPTLKKLLIFQKMELSSSSFIKLFMFQERTCNIWKITNFLYFVSNISAKEKSFLYFPLQRSKIF